MKVLNPPAEPSCHNADAALERVLSQPSVGCDPSAGVRESSGWDAAKGQYWMFEEVALAPQGGFRLHVTLDRVDTTIVAQRLRTNSNR